MNPRFYALAGLIWACAGAPPAHASAQMALDRGCFACHSDPPRRNAPTFAQLAQDYARHQVASDQELKLAEKLREGHVFGGIQAHEQLSAESARALVHWIIQGAR